MADLWAERFPGAVVRVGNDARCAALAEHWIGAAVDVDDSVTVLAGTALAAAITLGGEPYRDRTGVGEVGESPSSGGRAPSSRCGSSTRRRDQMSCRRGSRG
nr:ROK family protein [Tessaracoccus coleopterorum]